MFIICLEYVQSIYVQYICFSSLLIVWVLKLSSLLSLIFEMLDLEVEDGGNTLWFLLNVANERDARDSLVKSAKSWLQCLEPLTTPCSSLYTSVVVQFCESRY